MTPSVVQGGQGLPNVYCGLLTFMLFIIYFIHQKFALREKMVNLITLVIMYLFFSVNLLDYAIHGFHYPSGAPHRFAFIFTFYILFIGYQTFIHIGEMKRNRLVISLSVISALSIVLFILYPIVRITKPGVFTHDAIIYNIIFLIIYIIYLSIQRIAEKPPVQPANKTIKVKQRRAVRQKDLPKPVKKVVVICITAVIVFELASNSLNILGLYKEVPQRNLYILQLYNDIENVKSSIATDTSFYRMEQLPDRVFSDGKLFNYNNISIFSITYASVVDLLRNFGVCSSLNKIEYRLNTPLLNSIFAVKYSLDRGSKQNYLPSYFQNVTSSGQISLGQNPYALPVGFMVNNTLADWQGAKEADGFVFQNKFVQESTGITSPLFSEPVSVVDVKDTLLTHKPSNNGTYSYTVDQDIKPTDVPKMTYTYNIEETGLYYFYVNGSTLSDFSVSWSDTDKHSLSNSLSAAQMDTLDIGELTAGTQLTATVSITNNLLKNDVIQGNSGGNGSLMDRLVSFLTNKSSAGVKQPTQTGSVTPVLTRMDEDVFKQVYNKLDTAPLQVSDYSATGFNGSISVADDGVLFTSIPYDTRWHVYANGSEVPTIKLMGALMGVKLQKGEYAISMQYRPTGINLSYIITSLAFVVIIIIELILHKRARKEQV